MLLKKVKVLVIIFVVIFCHFAKNILKTTSKKKNQLSQLPAT
jgi:hypothetical protein